MTMTSNTLTMIQAYLDGGSGSTMEQIIMKQAYGDIVRLTAERDEMHRELRKAEIECSLLRNELTERIHMCDMRSEKIIELTTERDEARRYSCELEARIIVLEEDHRETSNKFGTNPCSEIILPDYPLAREPKEIAKQKGWDCFKEGGK